MSLLDVMEMEGERKQREKEEEKDREMRGLLGKYGRFGAAFEVSRKDFGRLIRVTGEGNYPDFKV